MIRYFVCENCHRGYEADDLGNTNCPYCYSDNVRPAKKPSGTMKYIGMAVLFAVFCVAGFMVPKFIDGDTNEDKKTVQVVSPAAESSVSHATASVPQVKDTAMVPIITQISTPVLSGDTYRFQVTVDVPSGDKVKIILMEEFGFDPLYTSADGNFKNIAPIKGGVYKVVAENVKTGDRSVEKFVNGCNPVQKIEKITQQQIQDAFNTGSIPTKDFMSKFVMAPKINVVGMEEGEPQVTNVGEVFNRIGSGLWLSVEVSDVNYASDNRVSSFTVKVTY